MNKQKMAIEYALSISKGKTIIWTLLFLSVGAVLFCLPGYLVFQINFTDFNLVSFFILLGTGVIIHELLHGLGWVLFGRIEWDQLRFGFLISKGVLFVHSMKALRMRVYRIGILFPGIILGILLPVAGLISGRGWVVVIGTIMFSGAAGDFIIFWKTREIPQEALVCDHPDKIGLTLVDEAGCDYGGQDSAAQNYQLVDLKGYLHRGIYYICISTLILLGLYYLGYYGGILAASIF